MQSKTTLNQLKKKRWKKGNPTTVTKTTEFSQFKQTHQPNPSPKLYEPKKYKLLTQPKIYPKSIQIQTECQENQFQSTKQAKKKETQQQQQQQQKQTEFTQNTRH